VSATTSSDQIGALFERCRRTGRKALVCYITAGHPTPAASEDLLRGLESAGADIIELGVPFSDPLADGPVIQRSSQIALENGMNVNRAIEMMQRVRPRIPVVLFSYLNPILAAGGDVLERAASAGVAGILITDLPLGADSEREGWVAAGPLAYVRLVAPTTPIDRMREIARGGSGFVYLIGRLGVTGEQSRLSDELPAAVERLRAATDLPVCVGFGISNADQARRVATLADGVVVGSAIVRAAQEQGVEAALRLTASLRQALDER
jgi:tryptophan synthase alpha chain